MAEKIKCLVWDLDNTLWNGTILEQGACRLRPGIRNIIKQLDKRGILMSIASANDRDMAWPVLEKKGLSHYFLHPQISWGNKVSSIQIIAKKLDIAFNAMAFIDDEPYEREQVKQLLPAVRTYDAGEYRELLNKPELTPRFVTSESERRREMYKGQVEREQKQEQFQKSRKDFLEYCNTQLTLRPSEPGDLPRILELMHRTHQMNATGKIYEPQQIESFLHDPDYKIFIMELKDRFVDYGKIGAAVCRTSPQKWELFSFFLSCRVLTRGIGNYVVSWLQYQAHKAGVSRFEGHFMKQERNHRMYLLYTMAGFKEKESRDDGSMIFAKDCATSLKKPDWLTVKE